MSVVTDEKQAWLSDIEQLSYRLAKGGLGLPHVDADDVFAMCGLVRSLVARVEELEGALTPSAETKAAFIGEFQFLVEEYGEVAVPWTTVKEIMAAIRALATRAHPTGGESDE